MVYGGLVMTKPDFSQMSRKELKAYVLVNREDDDAIKELIKRPAPNARTYPYPQTEADLQEMQALFQRKSRGEKGL
jgi:hypothetical protein